MGYAVYWDDVHSRWAGYGVPATCEHPGCEEQVNRGVECNCGGGAAYSQDGCCGQTFCAKHLEVIYDDDPRYSPDDHDQPRCKACTDGHPKPFPLKPECKEWVDHMATDPSWKDIKEPV